MPRTDVQYGNFSFYSGNLPIPTISLNTIFNKTDAGALIGATTNVTLNGKIIATGELNFDNNWPNFQIAQKQGLPGWASLIQKVSGLQYYFSLDYQPFDVKCNGQDLLKLSDIEKRNTKVTKIDFSNQTDQNWSQVIDYTIELQIERTGVLDYFGMPTAKPHYVSSIENSYSITPITDQDFYLSIPTSVDAAPPPANTGFIGQLYPYATGTDMYPGYNISRTLSATGKSTASGTALDNAKSFVTGMLQYDISFFNIIKNLTLFDRITSVDANPIDGTYSIKDSFKAYSGVVTRPYTESFDITSTLDEKLNRTISINGKIQGLKTLSDDSNSALYSEFLDTKNSGYFFPPDKSSIDSYMNASGYFSDLLSKNMFYNRVLAIGVPSGAISGYNLKNKNRSNNEVLFSSQSGRWINPIPLTSKADHNFVGAEISYSFSYDSRPLSLVSGAIQEDISISDEYSIRSTITQTMMNAPPLIQDLGTYSLPKRKVTYKGTFPAPIYGDLPGAVKNQIYNLIDNFDPKRMNEVRLLLNQSSYFIGSWITDNSENFDPIQGSFVKNITWAYELRRPL